MKILLVASWWPSRDAPSGGVFIEDQARVLARRHDVYVVAPEQQRWSSFPRWRRGGSEPSAVDGYLLSRPAYLPPIPKETRARAWAYRRAAQRAGAEAFRAWGRPDVIHAHVSTFAGFAVAGLRSVAPIVLTEHSWPKVIRLDHRAERELSRIGTAAATELIAVSEALAEVYRERTGRPVSVVPNVIDIDRLSLRPGARVRAGGEPVVFTLIGRLAPLAKGADVAIEAAAGLPREPAWQLRIVGDGRDRPNLERLAQRLGVQDRVRFLGFVPRPEIPRVLGETDWLVAPSRWETFGVAAAEALAAGVPVIASDTGGLRETVQPGLGVLVPPGDVAALRAAVAAALRDEPAFDPRALRDSVARRFGPEAFLASIEAVYARAVSAGARG